jgi:hypothetical protein
MTPPSPASRRAARLGTCGLVLASTVFGTVLVPAAAQATTSPDVTASLRTTVVNAAVTDAVFTFHNAGTAPATSAVEFDLPTGMVHNRLGARVDVETDGTHVRVAPSGALEPGASFEVPLYLLNAAGALPEHCSIDGAAVSGCSADDPSAEDADQTPGDPGETPGNAGETPGADAGDASATPEAPDAGTTPDVHITTPSYGVAGSNTPADVHQGWVAFPTDHAAPHELFTSDGSAAGEQALRNAIGRVFQQDVTRWTNDRGQADGTISQDLASFVLEEQTHGRNPLDSWRAKVERFRQQPVEKRDFWSNQMNSMTRHLVFDQLRRAFGEDFIATVSERARADVAAGSDREARRAFILQASHVAGHDLTPFFEQWGVEVEDDLRPHLAEYPALETPIWDDFDALH